MKTRGAGLAQPLRMRLAILLLTLVLATGCNKLGSGGPEESNLRETTQTTDTATAAAQRGYETATTGSAVHGTTATDQTATTTPPPPQNE